ncbi:hypothetical protein FHS38_003117 [Streptomyces netropsis]|uniref:Uncharacterized protein n=1 Tax=Streptomyces netropsis TaxID=55404 RepID=A0A7W7PEV5_STRNE|nr:hypothetical protein [Streptomyces netropsis]
MPRLRTREQPPAVVTECFAVEAVLAEGVPTVTMAEPAADLFAERDGRRNA